MSASSCSRESSCNEQQSQGAQIPNMSKVEVFAIAGGGKNGIVLEPSLPQPLSLGQTI